MIIVYDKLDVLHDKSYEYDDVYVRNNTRLFMYLVFYSEFFAIPDVFSLVRSSEWRKRRKTPFSSFFSYFPSTVRRFIIEICVRNQRFSSGIHQRQQIEIHPAPVQSRTEWRLVGTIIVVSIVTS